MVGGEVESSMERTRRARSEEFRTRKEPKREKESCLRVAVETL